MKNIGNKEIICLGDVHGRYDLLKKFLNKFDTSKYFIVQLGDLNDNTMEEIDACSTLCIEAFIELTRKNEAEVLYSNHHDKLLRYLNGNPIKPSHGFQRTIDEIERDWDAEYQGIVYLWLKNRPKYYEFNIGKLKYICVHAYMDDKIYDYLETPYANNNTKDYKWFLSQCIYGPLKDNKRFEWWDDPSIKDRITKFYLVSGHYHHNMRRSNFTICDTDDHSLVWYIPRTREMGIIK